MIRISGELEDAPTCAAAKSIGKDIGPRSLERQLHQGRMRRFGDGIDPHLQQGRVLEIAADNP